MSPFHEHSQPIARESHGNDADRAAWTTLARAMINLNKAAAKS